MSLTSPAHARNLQTNINQSRYFFATSEAGEQELGLSTISGGGPNGNISSLAVTISGPAGNAVVVSEGPSYMASEFISADQGAIFGSGSTYWTGSTITSTITGINLSSDRFPGSGTACIESYSGNGSLRGFEFLTRGVNSELVSTGQVLDGYISSIGRPGATAVLGGTGTILTPFHVGQNFNAYVPPATGGGQGIFTINDLSGANGVTPQGRWAIGTTGVPTGGNAGSDYALFAYNDAGVFQVSPYQVRRADGAMRIANLSSMNTLISTATYSQVYPINQTNQEFGAEGQNEVIAGATSNQALYGNTFAPLFSTILTNLNPNGQTFLSINWANALSTGSNHVNYKVGFSTATAYTNVLTTSYVPGGQFTGSDLPSANTPIGHTLVTCCLDPDGINPDGTGTLYVLGQLSDPAAAADQIFIAKGQSSEATRNALVWRPI